MLFYHVNTKIWSKKAFKMHISQSFFPALLSCAIWSCAMLDCFFDSFLITFYTRGSSSISQFTVASWYVVLDTPVVATGGYNVPVVATRGFLDPPGRCYRRILSSCSYYWKIFTTGGSQSITGALCTAAVGFPSSYSKIVLILDLGDRCHGRLGEEQEPEGKTNIKNRYKVLFIDTSLILKSEPRECGSQVSKGAGKLPRILPHLKIEKLTRVSITSKI